ncbi:MAG: hypothetical protein ACTMH4_15845 [Sphingobacterium sp.]
MFKLVKQREFESLKISFNKMVKLIQEQNYELNALKADLLQMSNQIERNKVLIENLCNNKKISLLKTKKDIEVVVDYDIDGGQIKVFDIKTYSRYCRWKLVLWWVLEDSEKTIKINDIQGGNRNGHGELALSLLIDWGIKNKKEKIYGYLSDSDRYREEAILSFYSKLDFKLTYFSEENKIPSHFAIVERYL